MKFEKNNKYFTISVYIVVSILVTILGAFLLINFKLMGGYIATFVKWLFDLFKPLIFGIIIAYLLDPLTHFFERWIKRIFHKESVNRSWPTLFTLLTFILIVLLFTLVIVMNVRKVIGGGAIQNLQDSLTGYAQYFTSMIQNMDFATSKLPFLQNGGDLIGRVYEGINSFVNWLSSKGVDTLTNLGGNLLNLGLGFVIAFYTLKDKTKLLRIYNRFLSLIVPDKMESEVRDIGRDIDYVFSGYIRGQLIDAVIMATLISVTLMVIGIDFAIIIGVISGIFNLIPYFGPVVGFILAGLIGFIGPHPIRGVYAVIAVMILQQIDGWFIVPKVMGKTVKLHPIAVLLAIVIGGKLFGLVGILLGVPTVAFIRLLIMRYMGDLFNGEEC
ncbi:AI-2E family transporter [Niameybacter massiliensis]|uniref:AI-2E family transporter n=1 Tax=Niameybacter massiliensis TaxID=1658108 RepID=UPI0006B63E5A|nr:AI-2E family transporter [Niameybacter massiliensis]